MHALWIIAALAVAGPALAQDPGTTLAERPLVGEGEAPAACVVGTATAAGQNIETSPTESGLSINLLTNAFVDGEGFPTNGTVSIAVPILCNSSHTLVVTSERQGLRSDAVTAPTNGFLNVAPYVLSLGWAGLIRRFDTSLDRSVTLTVPDAASGEATLTVAFSGASQRLIAGKYSDQLIVEVSAAY